MENCPSDCMGSKQKYAWLGGRYPQMEGSVCAANTYLCSHLSGQRWLPCADLTGATGKSALLKGAASRTESKGSTLCPPKPLQKGSRWARWTK